MKKFTIFSLILAFCFTLTIKGQESYYSAHEQRDAQFYELLDKLKYMKEVRVIVEIECEKLTLEELEKSTDKEALILANQQRVSDAQKNILPGLIHLESYKIILFKHIPYISLWVGEAELLYLLSNEKIISIVEDIPIPLNLIESGEIVDAVQAWASDYTGLGWTVAILDTGIDPYHPFLLNKLVSEACFSTNTQDLSVQSLCPDGETSSTEPGSGANCPLSISGCDHGTHVAGIAAGKNGIYDGQNFNGIAQDATIISIQVFSQFNSSYACYPNSAPCIMTYPSDQILGLERVFDLRNLYDIAAVNMSLGGGQYADNCDSDSRKPIIDMLRGVGIATVVSSGNSSYTNALGAPACISTAISVGSTTKSDDVSSFSNSASFLNLLATGSSILSSVPNSTYLSKNGTSMAAPHVAGAWAVLKQAYPNASVSVILDALQNTGTNIIDTRTGAENRIKPRININVARLSLEPGFILGNGTASNNNITYPAPLGNFYNGAKHQILISATELLDVGANAGEINSLGFNIVNLNNTASLQNLTLRVKSTSASSLDNFDNFGWTTVYENNSYQPVRGWNMLKFNNLFYWDGVSNILFDICFNNDSYTFNCSHYYTPTSYNSVIYYIEDGLTVCDSPGTPVASMNRPNIKINIEESQDILPPVLISPLNNSLNVQINPTIQWNTALDATSYSIQVSTNPSFDNTIINQNDITTTYYNLSGLAYNSLYYWRVRANDTTQTSQWSTVWTFQTIEELEQTMPILIYPVNNEIVNRTGVNLIWGKVGGALSYNVQVSTTNNFDELIINGLSINDSSYRAVGLFSNMVYYWRVNATNGFDTTEWSEIGCFEVIMQDNIRMSLIEKATNVGFLYYYTTFINFINNNYDFIIPIFYHTNWPSQNDPIYLYSPNMQNNRRSYYNITGVPTTITNGGYITHPANTQKIDSVVQEASLINSPVTITITNQLNNNQANISVNIQSQISLQSSKYLRIFIVEYNTYYPDYGNLYWVARKMFDGVLLDIPANGSQTINRTYSVDIQNLDIQKLHIVAFIQDDNSKEVLQAARIPIIKPNLLSPPNNIQNISTNTSFQWTSDSMSTINYLLEIATDINFSNIIHKKILTNNNYSIILAPSTQYFWRITANHYFGKISSNIWNFSTDNTQIILPPQLISPLNNSINIPTNPIFEWQESEFATFYNIQLSSTNDFENIIENITGISETYYQVNNLGNNTQYFWRVSASNSLQTSVWSEIWNFTTLSDIILPIPQSWDYVSNTGSMHSIILPTSADPMIGERPFENGDAVGFFFLRGNELVCAGYGIWENANLGFTVWGDDYQTQIKDGFNSGEAFNIKIWDAQESVEYEADWTFSSGPSVFTSPAYSIFGSLFAITTKTIDINLNTGWNLISSNVEAEDAFIPTVFQDVNQNLNIVRNSYGEMYLPEFDINTIGSWNINQGYQVNMNGNNLLSITGFEIVPNEQSISLNSGWHFISYLRNNPMNVVNALSSISQNLSIARNNIGEMYVPAYSINTIGNMLPGQGYQIYLTNPSNLTYPSNSAQKALAGENLTPLAKQLIPQFKNTGNNANLILDLYGIENGNEVGVYNLKDELIGSGAVHNGVAAITIWGDDEITNEIDGALNNELLSVKILNNNSLQNVTLFNLCEITNTLEQDFLTYRTNAIYTAKASVPEKNSLSFSISSIPNPTSSNTTFEFFLTDESEAEIEVYTLTGELVANIPNSSYTTGIHRVNFDASQLSNGVYNVMLRSGNQRAMTMMVVEK